MFKNYLLIAIITFLFTACSIKEKVDVIYFNGQVYTVDSSLSKQEAFAIKDGQFIAVGSTIFIEKNYESTTKIDLKQQFVYPGLIDAHSHFYGLGRFMQMVDLTGAKSWDECVERCKNFYETNKPSVLLGRGWDQNLWAKKDFPSNEKLNELFKNIPVLLKRVDGHAAIVNDFTLKLANINSTTEVNGGKVILQKNQPTGVLIDNAVDLVENVLPEISVADKIKALKIAEKHCFEYGLTSVCDAGLDLPIIHLIDSLQQQNLLNMRIYAMVSLNNQNLKEALKIGVYKTEKLNVSSFKMYADGALGSRGACLLAPYADDIHNKGFLLTDINKMKAYVLQIAASKFQLNTHCIGDSSNRLILNLYSKVLGKNNDRRWRIEHAQVVNPNDFKLFGDYKIIPSVQPTHATSDMVWAKDRLGKNRIEHAYAYQELLKQNSWLPLGTDFPVEHVSPFYTFYAAIARKDSEGNPTPGFNVQNSLTREQALKGITIWAAKAAFEENEKGSIEAKKMADFIVTSIDLLNEKDLTKIRNLKPNEVYSNGKRVK
ncbi:MAG: amidohydrolase [Bacteroidota bacterium]|jgi:predicted amidohydrolase YtcJ